MENSPYSVTLASLVKEFSLETLYAPGSLESVIIVTDDINRSGLQLAGFFDHFDETRLQLMGMVETAFIGHFTPEKRRVSFEKLMSKSIPALILSRGIEPFPECMEMARKYGVPLLRTQESTSYLISAMIASLKVSLAQRITRHGVLVEVYGEGILLLGDSGVGKSETAIELVKRGHRLIADDAVEIKKVSAKTLVGSAPEMIRHYIELRGIGVVDVRRIFGMGAVKQTEKIDLVINLELWNEKAIYDRLGLDELTTCLIDVEIPSLTVPVKPGRNLAVIIEVAAMNNRHKKMGYNAAREFTDRVNAYFEQQEAKAARENDSET
ncbi:MAG: HPr(Ser) kinase/phosphatase [Oscillospiraceae bacterium]|jgi:HPr kinase/phosphorylase|nr:HPr(Ser) kinase/phosphatase [Oscillospiraceae bacterium]